MNPYDGGEPCEAATNPPGGDGSDAQPNQPTTEQATTPPPAPAPPRPRGWWGRLVARQRRYHGAALPRWYSPEEALRERLQWWKRPNHLLQGLMFLALCFLFVCQASIHWIAVIDDSYITFRFVDMFVQGHGWRFSPEGPRVEGFTNFLWAVLLLPPHYLGWDLMLWSKLYGIACGIAAMGAAWSLTRVIRRRDDIFNLIGPAILATSTHFGHWALMGLETLLQTALVTWCYARFEKERRDARCWLLSPLIAVLAAMTRIDSLYYLSPLGVYGWWLVGLRRMPVKRLLQWAVLAAVPFGVYTAWRISYFGDPLPNTYYAKQRHVVNEGHGRGLNHLRVFYFDQASYKMAPPAKATEEAGQGIGPAISRFVYTATLARHNNWAWLNFWGLSAGLCVLAASSGVLLRRRGRPRRGLLREANLPKIACLVLAPWALNVYYVYHVNGDWMPGFRFFQVVLPFIGVAGGVGFGWISDAARQMMGRTWRWALAHVGGVALGAYLLVGTAYEQLDIGYIYIFGHEGSITGPRNPGWYKWDEIQRAYSKGFVPPLEGVSNWLLLNTQPNSWIFMSDIGQPMWFAEHLSLYDVDGLTDPHLAHAPSVRGDLPTLDALKEKIRTERGLDRPTRAQRREIEDEAKRRDFENHLERNARWIMEDRRPEYLLLFLSHATPDPKTQGWPYPQISERVYRHPNMKDYVEIAALPKIGNVFNHIYRRRDVVDGIADDVKFARLLRALERNPRMPLLIALFYEEAQKMQLNEEQQATVRRIMRSAFDRWTADPVMGRLANLARQGNDQELAEQALVVAVRQDPGSAANRIALSTLYESKGQPQDSLRVLEEGVPHLPARNNTLLYHLVYIAEKNNEYDKARRYARLAVERVPADIRAWSDLASVCDRGSYRQGIDDVTRLEWKKAAREHFQQYMTLSKSKPRYLTDNIERLGREIAELEQRLARPTPVPPTPTPAPIPRPAPATTNAPAEPTRPPAGAPRPAPAPAATTPPAAATTRATTAVPATSPWPSPPVVVPRQLRNESVYNAAIETVYNSRAETLYNSRRAPTPTDPTPSDINP